MLGFEVSFQKKGTPQKRIHRTFRNIEHLFAMLLIFNDLGDVDR